jgi:activator of HSP90 ATPase
MIPYWMEKIVKEYESRVPESLRKNHGQVEIYFSKVKARYFARCPICSASRQINDPALSNGLTGSNIYRHFSEHSENSTTSSSAPSSSSNSSPASSTVISVPLSSEEIEPNSVISTAIETLGQSSRSSEVR